MKRKTERNTHLVKSFQDAYIYIFVCLCMCTLPHDIHPVKRVFHVRAKSFVLKLDYFVNFEWTSLTSYEYVSTGNVEVKANFIYENITLLA